jgi:hypothetical protein
MGGHCRTNLHDRRCSGNRRSVADHRTVNPLPGVSSLRHSREHLAVADVELDGEAVRQLSTL